MVSACLGSLITSLVVTPFDVIRIRIQQQQILPTNAICCQAPSFSVPGAEQHLRNTLVNNMGVPAATVAETTGPELFWLHKSYCKNTHALDCTRINSTIQGFVSVSRNEGVQTLWRGLSLTLLMAVPSNIIYFTGYEYIRDHSPIINHPLNPLLCGAFARTLSATSVAPLELIKTRLQSIPSDHKSSSKMLSNLVKDLYREVQNRGVSSLFRGLQITLWRDVPFSGIYWLSYEQWKSRALLYLGLLASPADDWKLFASSFFAGSVSGLTSAFFTNPFDVGKTRLQICDDATWGPKKPSMFVFLLDIYRKEGIRALYAGFVPRALKIAPACAIMISSYEIGKKIFHNGNGNSTEL